MSTTTQTVKAVVKMPSKWGDRVLRVQDIQTKLTGNTYFPTGWTATTLTQTQFNADVLAFVNEANNAESHIAGAVGLRDNAFDTLKGDLELVIAMVQAKAKANPGIAKTIIESAGLFVRGIGGKGKRKNEAYNTQIPGKVIITADGGGQTEWEMSKDMIAIINLPATRTSITSVSGLTYGDTWYFRSKKVDTIKKTYNWSPWFPLKVGAGGRTPIIQTIVSFTQIKTPVAQTIVSITQIIISFVQIIISFVQIIIPFIQIKTPVVQIIISLKKSTICIKNSTPCG